MGDLVIRKRGGWDDGGKDGAGVDVDMDMDMMIIMKRYLLMMIWDV